MELLSRTDSRGGHNSPPNGRLFSPPPSCHYRPHSTDFRLGQKNRPPTGHHPFLFQNLKNPQIHELAPSDGGTLSVSFVSSLTVGCCCCSGHRTDNPVVRVFFFFFGWRHRRRLEILVSRIRVTRAAICYETGGHQKRLPTSLLHFLSFFHLYAELYFLFALFIGTGRGVPPPTLR